MRPDKAKPDSMMRRHGVTKVGSTPTPKDPTKEDSGVDLGYDEAMTDGSQDADEPTGEEDRDGDVEMAANDTAIDYEGGAEGDTDLVLSDFEEPDLSKSCSRHNGLRDTVQQLGSLLLNVPKELLAQILQATLKVDGPLSDHESHFICPTRDCSQKPMDDRETPILQYSQVREVLKTCRQIRNEGEQVFFENNEWTLPRPRLRKGVGLDLKALTEDTQRIFKRYIPRDHAEQENWSRSRIPHVRYFRNFNMRIAISPTATVDLPLPDGVDPSDTAGVERARISEDQEVVRRHTLTEAEQCQMYGAALSGFVNNQGGMFQDLRRLSLEIALHSPVHRARSSPLDRCGTTLKVKILLDASTKRDYATHPEPPTIFDDSDSYVKNLEPRRRMLAPLLELRGVRTVEVHRRWSMCYKVVKNESEDYIADHAMGQFARYDRISQFLEKAGPRLANLLNIGQKHFKIPTEDLIRVVEDDGDKHAVYDLVPPAEDEELLVDSNIRYGRNL